MQRSDDDALDVYPRPGFSSVGILLKAPVLTVPCLLPSSVIVIPRVRHMRTLAVPCRTDRACFALESHVRSGGLGHIGFSPRRPSSPRPLVLSPLVPSRCRALEPLTARCTAWRRCPYHRRASGGGGGYKPVRFGWKLKLKMVDQGPKWLVHMHMRVSM